MNVVDQEKIQGKILCPKSTKKQIVDYGLKNNKIRNLQSKNSDYKYFKNLSEDPSIGPKYLEKYYPEYFRVRIL